MLKDLTNEFYRYFFPTKEAILKETPTEYKTNDIKKKAMILYGGESSGKTETVRAIGEQAVEYYGEENVSIYVSNDGNLESVLDMLDTKLVNILFVDNLTRVKVSDETLTKYYRTDHRNIRCSQVPWR
jgi:chromosomal replication initiation ATPase DnaA